MAGLVVPEVLSRSRWLDAPAAAVLVVRAARVAGLLVGAAGRAAAAWLATSPRARRAERSERMADLVVGRVVRGGPTFVKMAQLLSTRVDLLPPGLCARLAEVHDSVPAMDPDRARRLADERLGGTLDLVCERFEPVAVASGSIACVYRATLRDGTTVAVKLRRAGVERVLRSDLALIRGFSRVLATLPPMQSLPVREVVDALSDAIGAQLDFAREAAMLVALTENLRNLEKVRIPAVRTDVVDPGRAEGILVMEFVPDLVRRTPADLPPDAGPPLAELCLDAVYQMLFLDGLVHNDLHPGNLYFGTDGSVVIVDAGFVTRLSARARRSFAEFFYAMALGDEARSGEILIESGTTPDDFDADGFRREISALVRENSGVQSSRFNLLHFAAALFDIQRRHRLYAEPEFVFPIISLLILEGTIKEFAPDTDFQRQAVPYVLAALGDPAGTQR